MAKGIYVGVGGAAKKVKQMYVGVGGVAKKVKKVYIGVNGTPKLVWQSDISGLSQRTMITNTTSASQSSGYCYLLESFPIGNNKMLQVLSYIYAYGIYGNHYVYVRIVTYNNGSGTFGSLTQIASLNTSGYDNPVQYNAAGYMDYYKDQITGRLKLTKDSDTSYRLIFGTNGSMSNGYMTNNDSQLFTANLTVSGDTITVSRTYYQSPGNYASVRIFGHQPNTGLLMMGVDFWAMVYGSSNTMRFWHSGSYFTNFLTTYTKTTDYFGNETQNYYHTYFGFNKSGTRLIVLRTTTANSSTLNRLELYSVTNNSMPSPTISLIQQKTVSIPFSDYNSQSARLIHMAIASDEALWLTTNNGTSYYVINYANDNIQISSVSYAGLPSPTASHPTNSIKVDDSIYFFTGLKDTNFIKITGTTAEVLSIKTPTMLSSNEHMRTAIIGNDILWAVAEFNNGIKTSILPTYLE